MSRTLKFITINNRLIHVMNRLITFCAVTTTAQNYSQYKIAQPYKLVSQRLSSGANQNCHILCKKFSFVDSEIRISFLLKVARLVH